MNDPSNTSNTLNTVNTSNTSNTPNTQTTDHDYNYYNNDEIENLKKDFYRFARLHSWYKHIPIEGRVFQFFQSDEQQVRYDFDKRLTNETNRKFWHFGFFPEEYLNDLQKNQTKIYQATFGPFLRGVEGTDDYKYFHGFHSFRSVIRSVNGNNHKIVIDHYNKKYPELTEFHYRNDEIIIDVASSEQQCYLDDVLRFNPYQKPIPKETN